MRSRLPLIAIALLLAGVVTFIIFQNIEGYKRQLEKKYASLTQGMNPVPVVVATQDITKPGTVITKEMIKVEQVPEMKLQPYAVQDPLDVEGKEPRAPIAQGQQILRNMLVRPGTVGGALSAKIPQEKRAISIEIDLLTGVSGFVRPNDHVDLLWTFSFKGGGDESQPVTLTLFQNIEVLAVGNQMRATAGEGAEGDAAEGSGGSTQEAKTVTLALTPDEAELLLFASQQGRIQLSLRPRADAGPGAQPTTVPPATMDRLLQQALPQAQKNEPPPPPPQQIEVIRGKDKEVLSLTPQGTVVSVKPAPASGQREPKESSESAHAPQREPAHATAANH